MSRVPRRRFLSDALRGGLVLVTGGLAGTLAARRSTARTVWQIDPFKCKQCGQCATDCVLDTSAVKCVHDYAMCGYCDLCTAFFVPSPISLNAGAENQLCPTGAIRRKFVEDPYFEYTIDESLCIGCGKCVHGCTTFGNGSLYLQVRHNLCVNCNECAIARNCPESAFVRLQAETPHFVKHLGPGRTGAVDLAGS
ncbi:MAG: ferredoxin [Kiritimatiellaeota bacterium]|nr:ferredoxin [Kiritimatiellota bacterium]